MSCRISTIIYHKHLWNHWFVTDLNIKRRSKVRVLQYIFIVIPDGDKYQLVLSKLLSTLKWSKSQDKMSSNQFGSWKQVVTGFKNWFQRVKACLYYTKKTHTLDTKTRNIYFTHFLTFSLLQSIWVSIFMDEY